MARLSNQAKIKRLRGAGYSRKDIARVTGSSVSAIGRAERGQTKGDSFSAPLGEFFKLGKRAKANVVKGSVSLPSALPRRTQPARRGKGAIEVASPLRRAEGKLSRFDRDTMVIVNVDFKDGSRSVLYSRGGIEAGDIEDLESAIESQEVRQYREKSSIDWDDVADIVIEEY